MMSRSTCLAKTATKVSLENTLYNGDKTEYLEAKEMRNRKDGRLRGKCALRFVMDQATQRQVS
jgi:hypothetical protein